MVRLFCKLHFIVKRALTYLVVLLVAANLDFIMPRLAPGNYADFVASSSFLPAHMVQILDARFGLNQPILTQYALYLKNVLLTFPPNFGFSYQFYPLTVSHLIISRIPATLFLIAVSMVLGLLISIGFAALGSMRRRSKSELAMVYSSITFHAIPAYWLALILIWVFAVSLNWFPSFGLVGPNLSGMSYVSSFLWHNVLPVITMTAAVIGHWYLIVRGATQHVLKSDFVNSAKVRGLRERVIALKYIVKNSMLPLVSVMPFSIAQLLSIDILVEFVFGYVGVGDIFGDAIGHRDYPALEGALFWVTLIVIIGGFISDLVLYRMDPRLRIRK